MISTMSISYKVVSKKPGGLTGNNATKYYPTITDRGLSDLDEVCATIATRSTFSRADVVGVVQAFIDLVPELLLRGNNVKLDGFGTFSVHASGNGKLKPEEVTARDITKLKLSFLPDKRIKKKLHNATFEKVLKQRS